MRSYYVRRKEHIYSEDAFHLKNLIPSVKHGGGSIMVWAFFAASWPGQPAITDGTMNSELFQQIIKENIRTSVKNRVSREHGSCSKTTTPSTQIIPPKNGEQS